MDDAYVSKAVNILFKRTNKRNSYNQGKIPNNEGSTKTSSSTGNADKGGVTPGGARKTWNLLTPCIINAEKFAR